MSPLIGKYYQATLTGPTYLNHHSDETKFYQFVKACIRYGRNSWLNGAWLRNHLERDLPNLFADHEDIEKNIRKAISLFDSLIDFHNTKFPNRSLEQEDL